MAPDAVAGAPGTKPRSANVMASTVSRLFDSQLTCCFLDVDSKV